MDDSRTVRTLLAASLEEHPDLAVVGTAASAAEARALIPRQRPDVITLDIEMPGMSGLDFLRELMRTRPLPVVMVSSLIDSDDMAAIAALRLGAVDCYPKPSSALVERFRAGAGQFAERVRHAASVRFQLNPPDLGEPLPPPDAPFGWNGRVVAIAGAAGGVAALARLLASWPADGPPALVVQRLHGEFIPGLIAHLDSLSPARVVAAEDGAPLLPGEIHVAPDEARHLMLDGWPDGRVRLVEAPPAAGRRPSADVLLRSVALEAKSDGVGVVLSGEPGDAARGLKLLHAAGGTTFAQDEATSLAHGMASVALAAGAVGRELPIGELAGAVLEACSVPPPQGEGDRA